MSWQPGQPVITATDAVSQQEWKRERTLQRQRLRRARFRRIDYYPSEEARAIIDEHTQPCVGGDCSSVINKLIVKAARRPKKAKRSQSVTVGA